MAGNGGYETSWADQWDSEPTYGSSYGGNNNNDGKIKKKSGNGGGGGDAAKKKVGEGLAKTKEVASTSMKKIKQGTSLGISWIKDKYQKTTQKH